jgi:hypothetical protein
MQMIFNNSYSPCGGFHTGFRSCFKDTYNPPTQVCHLSMMPTSHLVVSTLYHTSKDKGFFVGIPHCAKTVMTIWSKGCAPYLSHLDGQTSNQILMDRVLYNAVTAIVLCRSDTKVDAKTVMSHPIGVLRFVVHIEKYASHFAFWVFHN